MSGTILFQGRPVCAACLSVCEECSKAMTGDRRWTHGAAHWLPCILHSALCAITIWQPWADFIVNGEKRYETRSWSTDYRGLIAIHAGTSRENLKLFPGGHTDIETFGAIVGIAYLGNVRRTDDIQGVSIEERELGDWTKGRYAFRLDDVRKLDNPVKAKGKQGLWALDEKREEISCELK